MIIKDEIIKESYKNYLANKKDNWNFGNRVLYNLCKKHPFHDNPHEIVAKVWLIGRSYAAAIERTSGSKKRSKDTEDFYYDEVAPEMLDFGSELDGILKNLEKKSNIEKNLQDILRVHRKLTDTFNDISGLNKRSLASKYLHFHCKELFFIYDSRSSGAVKKIIQRPDKSMLSEFKENDYDYEYADFVCRMIFLKKYLEKEFNEKASPREIDTYLLSGEIEKVIKKGRK